MEKVFVGLGNPGDKYISTRHNTGFLLVDYLSEKKGFTWKMEPKFNSLVCGTKGFWFLKPQTFMNDSGTAVSKFLNFYKLTPGCLTLIHDEVDLAFGVIKKQYGPGSAGHRGVVDIIEKLGTQEFWRIRVGIGRPANPNIAIPDWVLDPFTTSEFSDFENIKQQVEKLVF